MSAWLLMLSCLVTAAPKLHSEASLGADGYLAVLQWLGFGDLYQASYVSVGLRALADQAIWSLYAIRHDGKAHLNYAKIIRDLDAVVQSAGKDCSVAEANTALQLSPRFSCIRSILEARFGCCIKYAMGGLPKFELCDLPLDILNDEYKISVLPYALDQHLDYRWIRFIVGLADLGRLGLLQQLTFAGITIAYYNLLTESGVPEAVKRTAAESLQRSVSALELPNLFFFAGLGPLTVMVFEDCSVPLYALRHLHENGIAIPRGCIFTGGLDEFAVPFWMHLAKKSTSEAGVLLDLVMLYGDDKARRLAAAFSGPVSEAMLTFVEKDRLQAALIHFHFSPVCNEHITEKFQSMRADLRKIDYYAASALLTWGQFEWLGQCNFDHLSDSDLEALVDKMYRLNDVRLIPLLQKCISHFCNAPKLLRRLIQRNADDSYVNLVWDAIQNASRPCTTNDYSCSAPVSTLKRLAFEPEISVDSVQKLLSGLNGFHVYGEVVSKEAHVLYTVLFWEASETVIVHFLDLVPKDCELADDAFLDLVRLKRYSDEFWRKFFRRFEQPVCYMRLDLPEIRPDLILELNRQD